MQAAERIKDGGWDGGGQQGPACGQASRTLTPALFQREREQAGSFVGAYQQAEEDQAHQVAKE
jgi:hypothetical protein